MTVELTYYPCCPRCRQPMGDVSGEEFREIVVCDGEFGLCFDCDPDSASTVPSLFWQWEEGDCFVIGGNEFWVEKRANSNTSLLWLSHARVRAPARSCLSSSTNLNKTTKNEHLDNRRVPQVNGYACSDCLAARRQGISDYCPYHHALLIEQHEDGALGWSNEHA